MFCALLRRHCGNNPARTVSIALQEHRGIANAKNIQTVGVWPKRRKPPRDGAPGGAAKWRSVEALQGKDVDAHRKQG